jgi:tetratricopeptide (TPR) repeat protein
MYTLILSLVLGVVTFVLVAVFFDPLAAVVPAVMVLLIALVALLLRVKRKVDNQMQGIVPLLQRRQVAEAQRYLESLRDRYAKWMPLLHGQIDSQLGMIDYLQLKFDQALPRLEKGKWRNWMALACIGAIHYRKGRHEQAWESLQKAVDIAKKEPMAYVVFAVLLNRAGVQDRALQVMNAGVKVLPDNKLLQELKNKIANKKKIKSSRLGDSWYQFFPEEMAAQAQMAARRGTPLPSQGFKGPAVSKQQRRGR